MDTRLPDKQIVVTRHPTGDQGIYGQKGDRLYIRLEVDRKIGFGDLSLPEDFQRLARPAYNNMQNQNWPAIVYRLNGSGPLFTFRE